MPETSMALPRLSKPVLFCALCDKPFTKEPQYKRHVAYCRKSQNRTRPRPCDACYLSKIKCNSSSPCNQCLRKGIMCLYDLQKQRRRHNSAGVTANDGDGVLPDSGATPLLSDISTTQADSVLKTSDLEVGESSFSADMPGTDAWLAQAQAMDFDESQWQSPFVDDRGQLMDLSETLNESSSGKAIAMGAPVSSFSSFLQRDFNSPFEFSPSNEILRFEDYSGLSGIDLQSKPFSQAVTLSSPHLAKATPKPPSPLDNALLRHFCRHTVKSSIQQAFATMIIDMISVYPRMITRRETFPPFVHAYSPSSGKEEDHDKLPGPLSNCMGIAQLFAVCNDDTRNFVWATIRAEMKQFHDPLHKFNKFESFAALQASLLYLVIRAVGGVAQEAKDDFEMLETHNEVCLRAMESNMLHGVEDMEGKLCWTDWIVLESARRTACVWFLLGLIFHIRTGTTCPILDNIWKVELPCSKVVWEAKTESQWRKEYEIFENSTRSTSSHSALRNFGDLLAANKSLPGSREAEALGIWNAGIDHLGMSLNLAVNLM